MNKNFTSLLIFLGLTLFSRLEAATGAAPEGEGKPDCTNRHEPASVNIALGQGTIEPVKLSIQTMADKLKVDFAKVDEAIENWFNDKKKNDAKFFTTHQEIWNTWIENTKFEARAKVVEIERSWNDKVSTLGTKTGESYESFVQLGPKGLVEGEYSWCEDKQKNGRDPGDPGWKLKDAVTFNTVQRVAVNASGGLVPVTINVELDGKVLAGGLVSTIQSNAAAKIDLGLPKDLRPDTPDPSNKPIAKTGFLPRLNGKLILAYDAHLLLILGVGLDIDVVVIFPRATGNIEAGKDL